MPGKTERISVSAQGLAELAARCGFSATADELFKACGEQGRLDAGELADAELDAAAGGSGKVSLQDFHFVKRLDKATP